MHRYTHTLGHAIGGQGLGETWAGLKKWARGRRPRKRRARPSRPAKVVNVPGAGGDELQQRMREAVAREDFAEAARLRDQMKQRDED